ncbi:formate dehydrogenase [Virgibacillus phasianinus]|uniref:Formate dehydrogenase n=1 Tax=Virgibacillus phasianinus TaxID=2017483 RepID=A0A220U1T6_9BACI|nr:DinB family protein [Virgibacillus phasianinus]ASK62050.1 formate dehydrogenase [Virgibacillus phasianinus]
MATVFDLTRNTFLSFVKGLDEETADVQPRQFNNTIHWHIGHVLVTAEGLLFGYPAKSANFPEEYNAFFKNGTKPADWSTTAPSIPEIIKHLEEQHTRINDLSEEFFQQDLPYTLPFGNFKTYGDIYDMLIHHENEHLGKMKAMKQVVDAD